MRKFKHKTGFDSPNIDYIIYEDNNPNKLGKVVYSDGTSLPCSSTLKEAEGHVQRNVWVEIKEPKIRRFTHSCKQIFLNQGVEYIEFDTEKPDSGIMYPSKRLYLGDLKLAESYVKQGFWVEIPVEEKQVKTTPLPKFKPGETVYIKYSNKIVCGTIEYSIFTGGQWAYYVHGFVEALAEVSLQSTPPALDN